MEGPMTEETPPATIPEDAAAAAANGKAKKSYARMGAPSSAERAMREEDDQSLKDWIDSMAGDSAIQIVIRRDTPRVGPGGELISGILETVTERVDEDYLRDMWGGGKFQLQIKRPNATGGFQYFKQRSIAIAGPPKMGGVLVGSAPIGASAAPTHAATHDDGPLAMRAFDSMQDNLKFERERAARAAEQAQRAGGFDVAALQTMNAPLLEQLRAANEQNLRLQAQVAELANRPVPTDSFRDGMLSKMFDGESARIETLRTQLQSEMRQEREHHNEELRRVQDRHDRDIQAQEARHEREIANLQRTIDLQLKTGDVAHGARLEAAQAESRRLERELTEAKARIGSLEAIKTQSITEKADEIMKVKEAIEAFGGDGDGEEKWYEKLIGAVGNSEAAVKILSKFAGQGEGDAGGPPVGVPFEAPDGNVYVRNADGSAALVGSAAEMKAQQLQQQRIQMARRKKAMARQRAAAAAGVVNNATAGDAAAAAEAAAEGSVVDDALADDPVAAAAPPPAPTAPPVKMRKPDAGEVKLAVQFMEGAIQSGTPPESFAISAQSLIPRDILAYIQQAGIDEFLNRVAKLESGSLLTTMRGRTFARAVARILLEGS